MKQSTANVKSMPPCKWCGSDNRGFNMGGVFFPKVRMRCAACNYRTNWYIHPIGAFREWCEPRV